MVPYSKTNAPDVLNNLWERLYHYWEALVSRLPNIVVAIVIMVLFYFLGKLISRLLRSILRKQLHNQSVRRIIVKLIYGVVMMVGFFIALGVLRLDKALTSLLAGAGVLALAIGLALQGTLSNTFSGIMLSFLPRIRIGDYIETDSHRGFVHEISMRNLVLRRPDNHFVIMPNSKFIEEPFVNFSLAARSRISVHARVALDADLKLVERLISEAIAKKFEQQANERLEFYYLEFGDFSINFMVRFWIIFVKKSQMYQAQHEAIHVIKDTLDAAGIKMPFPVRTIDRMEEGENFEV